MKRLAGVVAVVLSLAACQTTAQGDSQQSIGPKQSIGFLVGAGGGAYLGSQIGRGGGRIAAMGLGALLGAVIGSSVGRSLDAADRAEIDLAEQRAYAARVGQQVLWNNPQTGNYGSMVAVRDGYSTSGLYCRQFTQELVIGGQRHQGWGTACMMPDGSWRIVNG